MNTGRSRDREGRAYTFQWESSFQKSCQRPAVGECGPVLCSHCSRRDDNRRPKYALNKRDTGLFWLTQTSFRLELRRRLRQTALKRKKERKRNNKQLQVVQVADYTLRPTLTIQTFSSHLSPSRVKMSVESYSALDESSLRALVSR